LLDKHVTIFGNFISSSIHLNVLDTVYLQTSRLPHLSITYLHILLRKQTVYKPFILPF